MIKHASQNSNIRTYSHLFGSTTVLKGDVMTLGRRDNWDGNIWIWATTKNTKQGWVPDSLPCEKEDQIVAAYDYSAVELTVNAGDVVTVIREHHGWAWCIAEDSQEGWIPLRNLG